MYYIYTLKSAVNGDLYIGYTKDLYLRLKQHNNGHEISTKANKPWLLVYYEAYRNKFDATKREKQIKNHAAKNVLRNQICGSLEVSWATSSSVRTLS